MIDRILVNREECEVRVAFLEKDTLVELHTEKFDEQTIVNNIYRGRVQDVVPGLQAAFVDVGLERNMFLHFMDIRPESLVLSADDQFEAMKKASENPLPGRIERRGRRPRQDPSQPQAESPVKKGDEIIVQVVKDEIGGKAPRVTTNLSLAGRYLVLLPFPSQDGGVSRKIAMGQDRFRLKKLLASLRTSEHSFIVRTAGLGQTEEAIQKDAEALERLWLSILQKYRTIGGPGLVNSDDNLIARLVRDAFPAEFQEVVCDYPRDGEELRSMLLDHMPGAEDRVRYWEGVENIFDHYGVEKQIQKAMDRKVWLKSGGSLIIDENEALTAIDVNTGRFTGRKEQEKTSLKTNLEACEAIAQQIRLRDIGGIIVIDFIDMVNRSHQDRVSEELKRHLKGDRAKSALGKIGDFGVMMLTRKRQRMSLQNQLFEECPYCKGTGLVLLPDEIFRRLKYDLKRLFKEQDNLGGILVTAHPRLIGELTSRFSRAIEDLSSKYCEVFYKANADFHLEEYQVTPIKGVEGEVIRLPGSRLDDADRVLPVANASDVLFTDAIAARQSEAPVVEIPRVDEAPSLSAPAPREKDPSPEGTGTGPRKRRRRGRRDGAKIEEATVEVTAEVITATPSTDEQAASSSAPATETEEEAKQRKRRESSAERRARRRRARDRRQDDGTDQETDGAATEVVNKPAPIIPTGPLKLPTVTRDPKADLLAGVLDEIDESIKTIKTTPEKKTSRKKAPAKTSQRATAAAEKKAAAEAEKRRKELASVFAELEENVESLKDAPPAKEAKPKRKTAGKGRATKTEEKPTATKSTGGRKSTGRTKKTDEATTSAAKEKKAPAAKASKTTKTTKSKAAKSESGSVKATATKTTKKATTTKKAASTTTKKSTPPKTAKKASTTGETKAKSTRAKAGAKSTRAKKATSSSNEPEAKKSARTTTRKTKSATSKSTSKSSKE